MSTITERLKDAVNQFPAIDDHPYTLFFDSLAEIERLQSRVAELYSALDSVNERLADGCQLSGDEIDDVDAALLNTGCEAFILRKQADAVLEFLAREAPLINLCEPKPPDPVLHCCEHTLMVERQRLHNEAAKAGGGV